MRFRKACIDIGAFSQYRDVGFLLQTEEGQDAFRSYLDREYCSEYVDFVVSIREFQDRAETATPEGLLKMATDVFNVYISPSGDKVIVHDA